MISYGSCGKYEFYMARITNTETMLIFDVTSGKITLPQVVTLRVILLK
jgi:hypothetical protein